MSLICQIVWRLALYWRLRPYHGRLRSMWIAFTVRPMDDEEMRQWIERRS